MNTTIIPDVSVTEAYTTPGDSLVVKFSNGAKLRSRRTYTYVLVETWTPGPDVTGDKAMPVARVVSATGIYDKAQRWRNQRAGSTGTASGSRFDTFVLRKRAGGTYEVWA